MELPGATLEPLYVSRKGLKRDLPAGSVCASGMDEHVHRAASFLALAQRAFARSAGRVYTASGLFPPAAAPPTDKVGLLSLGSAWSDFIFLLSLTQ